MNPKRKVNEMNRAQILLSYGFGQARKYGICVRVARQIVRYGLAQYKRGGSLGRALSRVDEMARAVGGAV